MAGQWQSSRDGHSYSDLFLDADAHIATALGALEIGCIRARRAEITAPQLHALLWSARQHFPELQLRLELTPATKRAIEACAERGSLFWDLIQNPLSQQARIIDVVDPAGSG